MKALIYGGPNGVRLAEIDEIDWIRPHTTGGLDGRASSTWLEAGTHIPHPNRTDMKEEKLTHYISPFGVVVKVTL